MFCAKDGTNVSVGKKRARLERNSDIRERIVD